MRMRTRWFIVIAAAAMMAACTETQLYPETRDGMFYTVFAEAQQLAIDQDKLILAAFWRPG
jgi:hypothetical protein